MKRILIIFLTLNSTLLTLNLYSQWVQQSVPVTSGSFFEMKFVNANTGFIAHGTKVLLRTTNAGNNWESPYYFEMFSLSPIDSNILFATGYRGGYGRIYKTTNSGISWDSLLISNYIYGFLHFFNKDTGVISSGNGTNNQIWRTTDGGQTIQLIQSFGGATQGTFFFLKEKINGEYYGWMYYPQGNILRYTTNSGLVWYSHPILTQWRTYKSIFFINQDTGWATTYGNSNNILYTTNGGNNWSDIYITHPTSIYWYDIFFLNPLTGWVGSDLDNVLLITTNGGNNWGTQSIPGSASANINFVDSLNGWVQTSLSIISHTTNGGGTITSIISGSTETQNDYRLYQNYPNPFNPTTVIRYQLSVVSEVSLKVFDVQGREVQTLVNETLKPGTYETTFDASALPTGIYFYQLFADGIALQTRKMILLK